MPWAPPGVCGGPKVVPGRSGGVLGRVLGVPGGSPGFPGTLSNAPEIPKLSPSHYLVLVQILMLPLVPFKSDFDAATVSASLVLELSLQDHPYWGRCFGWGVTP